ncbi:MAG: DUF1761 domain-containing protein [Bacteroidetes bacterium]|nr:DUF1761 domain-containing protein [Bacteroidota bacterium]MCL2303315.1 DUF1761 domain-containing protein [Lentimicrobiaceae bacterium]
MTCCELSISWLWYIVAVLSVFFIGFLWYNQLFGKKWLWAVRYDECPCGADLSKREKCTCKPNFKAFLPMIVQFLAICLLGLMYFVLVKFSICLAVFVWFANFGWMKASLLFKTPNRKRFMSLLLIDGGYFLVTALVFILFGLI